MPAEEDQIQTPAPANDVSRLALEAYRKTLNYLFLSTSSIVGLLVVAIFCPRIISRLFHQDAQPISIFLLVVVAGTLGAFFSALLCFYGSKSLPAILYEDGLLCSRARHLHIDSCVDWRHRRSDPLSHLSGACAAGRPVRGD